MNSKRKIIAKFFETSSNIDEKNIQIFDIKKHILQSCLTSPIIRHWLCTLDYKERSNILNETVNDFYNLEKNNSQIEKTLLIDYLISKNEEDLFSLAADASMYSTMKYRHFR